MATASAYAALTDSELRARLSAVMAMPNTPARAAELATIRAEVTRRGSAGLVDTAQIEAQAGGHASSAAAGVRDIFAGALDEIHTQEEQAATWLRWGTVAFALLVILLVVVIGAWFFAPARALVGGLGA